MFLVNFLIFILYYVVLTIGSVFIAFQFVKFTPICESSGLYFFTVIGMILVGGSIVYITQIEPSYQWIPGESFNTSNQFFPVCIFPDKNITLNNCIQTCYAGGDINEKEK